MIDNLKDIINNLHILKHCTFKFNLCHICMYNKKPCYMKLTWKNQDFRYQPQNFDVYDQINKTTLSFEELKKLKNLKSL